jgi:hypothetical protein
VAASSAPAPSLRLRPSSRASLRAAKAAALALGVALGGAQRGQPVLGLGQRRGAVLDLGVQAVAVLDPLDLRLELVVLLLHGRGPGPGLLVRGPQPAELRVRGGHLRAHRADPAGQLRQGLPAVGGRAHGRREPPLLGPVRRLGLAAPAHRVGQRLLGLRDLLGERVLLLADVLGLALHLLRVAARPLGLRALGQLGEVAHALPGQRAGAAQPLTQRGEPSSASSRSRASRRSAWIATARRATSACWPSGLSWRRSSVVRSVSRVRLACIASSLRSAFSLRLRCLRMPAASSMNAAPLLGSGPCSTASSWPWPTMTCISRPMPESESSSWMSSSRQGARR